MKELLPRKLVRRQNPVNPRQKHTPRVAEARREHQNYGILAAVFVFGWVLLLSHVATAQDNNSIFNFTGGFGLHYDGYQYSQENFPTFRPRHPANLGRFTADATLSAGQHFRMPFAISISTRQNSYNLPSLPDERLIDYIQNPRNNISFNPSYRWATAFLGTQTASYSELTSGDIPMFGVGLELDPGKFLFSVNYGKSQTGVEYDPFNNIAGAYEQRIFASRIGYGNLDGTRFTLNLVKSSDDPNSVQTAPPAIRPAEVLTLSPMIQVRMSPTVLLATEVAGSVNTSDLNGPDLPFEEKALDVLKRFIDINASSNADFSNVTSLEWRRDQFGIAGEVRYVGPGFQPAGYRTFERDIIDYTIRSDARMLSNRLMVNGTFGIRTNNLQSTTLDKTNRTIVNLNVFTQATEQLSVNTSYANFGFRNNVSLDTLRVEMINNTFSVTPTYQFKTENHTHVVSLTGSYNQFDDFNIFTGGFQSTLSYSLNTMYQVVFNAIPLNAGFQAMILENTTPVTDIRIINTGINVRYRMFDKKFTPALLVGHTYVLRDTFTADNRWRINLKADYKLYDGIDLRASYNFSNYRYGSSRPGALTFENRFQLALISRF
ncbi:MAG: hypothetical protein LAT57_03285 [Balneolales bacterium]|nr:hypothetical protein [Balneolales bacterium]